MAQLKVFLIAGEVSGDYCGSKLISSLRKKFKGNLMLKGIGGHYMKREGFDSIFPLSEIAVMGIAEIIPRILKIRKLINFTARAIEKFNPDIIVTIDAPGFCFRVVKKIAWLKRSGTKFVHYVSPSVWVYNSKRVYEMARYYDLVLALLPFEPKYYNGTGLRCEYVGHHLVETNWDGGDNKRFRKKHAIAEKYKIIGVLPGSRESEVKILLPIFIGAINKFLSIEEARDDFIVVYPSVSNEITNLIGYYNKEAEFQYKIVEICDDQEKLDMMNSFYMALVKSGTSSLEVVFAKTPMIVGYKVNWFTAFVARKIFRIFKNTKFVSIANIILGKEVIPEFLQEQCDVDHLSSGLIRMVDKKFRNKQIVDYARVIKKLTPEGLSKPSERAAEKIIELQK